MMKSEEAKTLPKPATRGPVWCTEEEWQELLAWRGLGDRLELLVARCLAAQGDHPEQAHIELQHKLAELLRPPERTELRQSTLEKT